MPKTMGKENESKGERAKKARAKMRENTCKFYTYSYNRIDYTTHIHRCERHTLPAMCSFVGFIQDNAGSNLDEFASLYVLVAREDHTTAFTLQELVPLLELITCIHTKGNMKV